MVHASIGAIQSTLFYRSGLTDDQLEELLVSVGEAPLFVAVPSDRSGLRR